MNVIILREIQEKDNKRLAEIIRYHLKKNHLDIPGTVYFDKELDHLSQYYLASEKRSYVVAVDEEDRVVGGIGLAQYPDFKDCAELQKLYLCEEVQGNGYGYLLIEHIKKLARAMGYQQMYLETHSNLQTAIHMYQKSGFREIRRPENCVHSTMDRFFLVQLIGKEI